MHYTTPVPLWAIGTVSSLLLLGTWGKLWASHLPEFYTRIGGRGLVSEGYPALDFPFLKG